MWCTVCVLTTTLYDQFNDDIKMSKNMNNLKSLKKILLRGSSKMYGNYHKKKKRSKLNLTNLTLSI